VGGGGEEKKHVPPSCFAICMYKGARKATVSLSCPSVFPHGTTRLLVDGFSVEVSQESVVKIGRE
jgi:hypothetical protein